MSDTRLRDPLALEYHVVHSQRVGDPGTCAGVRPIAAVGWQTVRAFSLVLVAAWFGVPSVFYGDALGLGRIPVIVFAVVGSMIGVMLNLMLSGWLAVRLRRRAESNGTTSRVDRISSRAAPIVDRFGMVGFGLAGPVVLGTFGSALVAPVIGVPRRRAFFALLVGVTVWCGVFGVIADVLVGRLGSSPGAS